MYIPKESGAGKVQTAASVLTDLHADDARGIFLSKRVFRHTRVVARVLHTDATDLHLGVFPSGTQRDERRETYRADKKTASVMALRQEMTDS